MPTANEPVNEHGQWGDDVDDPRTLGVFPLVSHVAVALVRLFVVRRHAPTPHPRPWCVSRCTLASGSSVTL